jgi:hypothetical protein
MKGGILRQSGRGADPVAVGDTSGTATLKLRVIDNVEMIKQLYATEKQLTDRVQKQEIRMDDLQHEARVLQVENQSLREKLEVLEYLLAKQDPEDETTITHPDHEDPTVEEIPGYGSLMASSTSGSLLPKLVPSDERIRDALGRKATPPARGSNQETPSRPPQRRRQAAPAKRPKKADAETGLLSVRASWVLRFCMFLISLSCVVYDSFRNYENCSGARSSIPLMGRPSLLPSSPVHPGVVQVAHGHRRIHHRRRW